MDHVNNQFRVIVSFYYLGNEGSGLSNHTRELIVWDVSFTGAETKAEEWAITEQSEYHKGHKDWNFEITSIEYLNSPIIILSSQYEK